MNVKEVFPIFEQGTPGFDEVITSLQDRGIARLESVEPAVRQILVDVRHGGDVAVRRYASRMDGRAPTSLMDRSFDGEGALQRLPKDVVSELKFEIGRLQRFFQRQREPEFRYEEGGLLLGQRWRPVRRAVILASNNPVGIVHKFLWSAVPAQVAGVSDLLLAVFNPTDLLLAAAHLIGITAIVRVGGAQAVAALAFGTETIPRVDVIAGDGGLYAACAKRLVLGHVQVDGVGGPSERLILMDSSARPLLVAADLLALAEQEEEAWPLVISIDAPRLFAVQQEVARQLSGLPRRGVAQAALEQNGRALLVRQREKMLLLAESLASAQVVFHVERPEDALDRLRSLGEAAWGPLTPSEMVGRSLSGAGSAHCWGASGIDTFLTRTTFARMGASALRARVDGLSLLARADGREGWARSVELRMGSPEAKER